MGLAPPLGSTKKQNSYYMMEDTARETTPTSNSNAGPTETHEMKDTVMSKEQPVDSSSTSNGSDDDQRKPQLHAKTWLAVLAVCMIYFAQLVLLVGAGAVSSIALPIPMLCPEN